MNAPMQKVDKTVLDRIKGVVTACTTNRSEMAPHLEEIRGLYHGDAAMLVFPGSTAEVAEVVRLCAENRLPLVPQGGNTGLVGGGVPHAEGGEIIVNLKRMSVVRAVDATNHTMTVEAGCVLADVQAAAQAADRLFPLSFGAEGSCQIGGNIATNAGGTGVLRYGNMRELVLGLEVVLADGSVWDGLRTLRKDNTGYDIKQLFIGAEGTLGIITAAVLKLFPRPHEVGTALAAVTDPSAAVELFERARAATGDLLTACELIPRNAVAFVLRHIPGCRDPMAEIHPYYVLIELSAPSTGFGDALENLLMVAADSGTVRDAVIAGGGEQAKNLWRLRDSISEAQRAEGGSIKHDVTLPLSRLADFIGEASAAVVRTIPGSRVVPFGHLGDGNIHFNVSQPEGADRKEFVAKWANLNRVVHDIAVSMGGSFSAEHGIGRLKREVLAHYRAPLELDLMRRLKSALDPHNIMNPGKVLPSP